MTNEKVISYIAGIMNAGGFTDWSILGKGKMFHPETTMIITNKRLLLIAVPLPGAGQVIGTTNISIWQLILARKDIEKKLKEMLSSMSLRQIMNSNEKNYAINLADIKKVKLTIFKKLIIITRSGKKYKYYIRDKNDQKRVKEIFKEFM